MAAIQTQDSRILGDATVAELAAELRGDVIRPGDDEYDAARALWNAAHDRQPALIVRCAGVADVIAALRFARSQSLEVAVRGGGHSIAGFSGVDGGLVIDLSAMRGVRGAAGGGGGGGGGAPAARTYRVVASGGTWTWRRRCTDSRPPAVWCPRRAS